MIVTKTPMRISFAGGGTDLAEFYLQEYGSVVATAIDKYVYVVLKEHSDSKIRIMHQDLQIAENADLATDELIAAALQKVGVSGGVEVVIMADNAQDFSGLGASGSLTVGLLNTLYAYKGSYISADRLAQEACEIEIETLKRPGGKQNQYMAAYGGLRHLMFRPDGTASVQSIELSENHQNRLLESLLLFKLEMSTEQDQIMSEQIKKTARNTQTLQSMRNQADDLAKYLKVGAVASLGQTLREGWMCKKTLASKISNPQIDQIVDSAISAGAIGAKVTGAGGGGFLLVCVPPEKRTTVKNKLGSIKEVAINFSKYGSRIIFNES